ncbi:hypothetical protein RIR_jg4070.t1 [Rhizophagus irregularis DAOM 181602=DAOM 197198]|nr:hypothetical protein RIR_jg4070.t1 [Rhizophagus irregularis DAOM 181602=DAOM 197198]
MINLIRHRLSSFNYRTALLKISPFESTIYEVSVSNIAKYMILNPAPIGHWYYIIFKSDWKHYFKRIFTDGIYTNIPKYETNGEAENLPLCSDQFRTQANLIDRREPFKRCKVYRIKKLRDSNYNYNGIFFLRLY